MNFKDNEAKALWLKGLDNNQDPYGRATYVFAEQWADLMESRILEGENLSDMASRTSHDADTDGITGFMYGCAVSTLSAVWEHGEALRQWHNLDSQIGTEGEKANESGGVLNPAVLNIST